MSVSGAAGPSGSVKQIHPFEIKYCNFSDGQLQRIWSENCSLFAEMGAEMSPWWVSIIERPVSGLPQIEPLTIRTSNLSLEEMVTICSENNRLYAVMGLRNVHLRVVNKNEGSGEKIKVFVLGETVFAISPKKPRPLGGSSKIEREVTLYHRLPTGELQQDPGQYVAFKTKNPCESFPLKREVDILTSYASVPGVVQALGYIRFRTKKEGEEKSSFTELMVMPRACKSLKNALTERFTFQRVSALALEMVRAVAKIHSRGDIHRNLKPSHILLDDRENPLIASFGACLRFTDRNRVGLQLDLKGTPKYIAPECAGYLFDPRRQNLPDREREKISQKFLKQITQPASDVWSLGVIMYKMLQKENPLRFKELNESLFPKKEVKEFLRARAELTPDFFEEPRDSGSLEHVIWEMLKVDPRERITLVDALAKLERMPPEIARASEVAVESVVPQDQGRSQDAPPVRDGIRLLERGALVAAGAPPSLYLQGVLQIPAFQQPSPDSYYAGVPSFPGEGPQNSI